MFTNRNRVHLAGSNVEISEIKKNQLGELNKACDKVGNYSVSTYNRFDILTELDETNASNMEQGVGVDDFALTKCNVERKK